MEIRRMSKSDLSQVNDIVNWHTEYGTSTFLDKTSMVTRSEWFQNFKQDSQEVALVAAEEGGSVLGFATSVVYRGGGVFKSTHETSIYLHLDQQGKGIGTQLYKELFSELNGKGIHRVVIGIALPNDGSVALHKKFGFENIGVFDEYAWYKGAYRSSLWMQKKLS